MILTNKISEHLRHEARLHEKDVKDGIKRGAEDLEYFFHSYRVLLKAADLIDKHGWLQNVSSVDSLMSLLSESLERDCKACEMELVWTRDLIQGFLSDHNRTCL